ncbi:MAG: TlpA family protein disulfide reductase [Clostridiales bacterium]|nr:TlpA family protein disulfide reductase [Clostridiales bacterium]
MKRFMILLITILIMLSGCGSDNEILTAPDAGKEISSNNEFPYFTTQDLYGNAWTQEIFNEYVLTMVNIWGTYCGPCIDEMPDLGRLYKELDEMNVNLIGIMVDVSQKTNKELALQITEKSGATYTHLLMDENIFNYLNHNISAIPTTIFVDSKGNVVGMPVVGALKKDEYKEIIKERLKAVSMKNE